MRFLFVLLITISFTLFSCNKPDKNKEESSTEISSEDLETIEIDVKGMTCGNCEKKIVKEVTALDGVQSATASHTDEKAVVEYDPSTVNIERIKQSIDDAGYEAHNHRAAVGNENE